MGLLIALLLTFPDPKSVGAFTQPDGGITTRVWCDGVNITTSGGGGSGPSNVNAVIDGGRIDVNNFPTTYPVTGTFWQSTQPVSLAVAPTTPVTQSGGWGMDLIDGGVWIKNFPATQPVTLTSTTISNFPAPDGGALGSVSVTGSVGVTGTFWPAIQPIDLVDGGVWVKNFPASQPVTASALGVDLIDAGVWIKNFPTSTAVTGTFFQSTQPVSIATMPSTPVTGTFWQVTQPVSGTFFQSTQPVSIAGTVSISGAVTATVASTTITGNVAVTQAASSITGSNPCSNPTATILGLSGATSGTIAVQLIGVSGSTKIYVCSVNITGVSGTTPTFSLKYGTGTACATGGVTIIGPVTTTANTIQNFVGPTFAVTPAGQELCYLDSGTTPIQNYNITYVQQ